MANGYRTWGRSHAFRLSRVAYADGLPAHVVLGTLGRQPVFARQAMAEAVFRVVRNHAATAACLMPDHLHWLLRDGEELSATIGGFKAFTTRCAWACGHRGRLWQRSF